MERIDPIGTLIEFATSNVRNREGVFGLIDIDGIKIVGGLRTEKPSAGMKMKMSGCGLREDGSPFYDFEAA
ncbi:MAG TPA: hypothetical protein VGQ03_03420 [Nitrososphaera sp.]|nr:hypothetical protein [Nitrososphaera sp.]